LDLCTKIITCLQNVHKIITSADRSEFFLGGNECLFVCIIQRARFTAFMDQAMVLAYHISDPT
jgi:hypothetical protein